MFPQGQGSKDKTEQHESRRDAIEGKKLSIRSRLKASATKALRFLQCWTSSISNTHAFSLSLESARPREEKRNKFCSVSLPGTCQR